MSKRVAVYYCGGCNPRYDRVGAVRTLMVQFPELTFVLPDEPPYDGCLAVCGCTARCALQRMSGTLPMCTIRGTGDLAAARRWLQVLETT